MDTALTLPEPGANIESCRICGYPLSHQHHILPRRYGGTDHASNMIALCPNHHAAIHIIISEFVWRCRDAGMLDRTGDGIPPLSDRHRALLAIVCADAALVTTFNAIFPPRWRAATSPLSDARLRRIAELLTAIDAA